MTARCAPFLPLRRGLTVLTVVGALSACGGGVWIGIGGDDDDRPSVSLVASVTAAAPGQTFRLSAAAADDYGVERVSFHRLTDEGTVVLLGEDDAAPFQWDTVMPNTASTRVRYFARAVDGAGQRTDSDTVSVTVLR